MALKSIVITRARSSVLYYIMICGVDDVCGLYTLCDAAAVVMD